MFVTQCYQLAWGLLGRVILGRSVPVVQWNLVVSVFESFPSMQDACTSLTMLVIISPRSFPWGYLCARLWRESTLYGILLPSLTIEGRSIILYYFYWNSVWVRWYVKIREHLVYYGGWYCYGQVWYRAWVTCLDTLPHLLLRLSLLNIQCSIFSMIALTGFRVRGNATHCRWCWGEVSESLLNHCLHNS